MVSNNFSKQYLKEVIRVKILSVTQMKELEEKIIERGLNQELLMENAGNALYSMLKNTYNLSDKKILILAGPGNNGGDALVLARKLKASDINSITLFVQSTDSYKGASLKNFDLFKIFDLSYKNLSNIEDLEGFINQFDIIVDGIFGIGLNKNIEGDIYKLIEIVNNSKKEVVSIDIPSGINADNGKVLGISIKAKKTLALGAFKKGNIFYPGAFYNGDLILDRISIPSSYTENIGTQFNVPKEYPDRNEDVNKGSFGKVLFVGGGRRYYGAPYMNSVSFLKSGGSYGNLACPESLVNTLALKAHEIVFYPLKETREGNISIENLKFIIDTSEKKDLVVIGGGFSQEEEPQRLINILISKITKALIIDADGLNAIKDRLDSLLAREFPTVLTPHMGEFSKLTGKSIEEIKANSVEIARNFAEKYRVILVLKDSKTIIANPKGEVYINTSGNSALAVAGSGDILAGLIAGQFALGLDLESASRMGVFLHGLCGDLLATDMGADGLMSEDILNHLPKTLKYYRDNYQYILKKYIPPII